MEEIQEFKQKINQDIQKSDWKRRHSTNLVCSVQQSCWAPNYQKRKKVLKEITSRFKPYPKRNDSISKKHFFISFALLICFHYIYLFILEKKAIGGKPRKRKFFYLPREITENVPSLREWTRLIAYGVGQTSIQGNRDASSKEHVRTLHK